MIDHAPHHDIAVAIICRLNIFDIGRLARTSKYMTELCRREMLRRIGPRNFEIVTGLNPITFMATNASIDDSIDASNNASISHNVTHDDLKYFYREVVDAGAYWPLVIALRRRYLLINEDTYTVYKDECIDRTVDDILIHWVHVGLTGCARLLRWIKEHEYDCGCLGSCEYRQRKVDQKKIRNGEDIDVTKLSQEQLFWYLQTYMRLFHNDRAAIDLLDHHHFNLFVEAHIKFADSHDIIRLHTRRSNVKWLRYDPYFAQNTINRLVRPAGLSDIHPLFATSPGIDFIFARLPADFEPDMSMTTSTPLDTLRPCPTCKIDQAHRHLPHHLEKVAARENGCICECHDCDCSSCGDPGVKKCWTPTVCQKCKCCYCAQWCMCECKCGAVCSDSCVCCKCMNGCICYLA